MNKLLIPCLIAGLAFSVWYEFRSPHEDQAAPAPKIASPQEPNVLRFAQNAPQLTYLQIAPAKTGQIPSLEPLQGQIAYDENATSRITAPIAGRVTRIDVQLGDHVKAGQALLTLDSPDYAQASADARHAGSDLRLKQAAYERAKTLLDGGVLARKDFESAEADQQQAQIEMDRAHARLRNLGPLSSGSYVLTTHIGGVVTERQVNPGSEIRPDAGNNLFVVSDPKRLWVNVEVPEKDLGKIHNGQHMRIESDAYPDMAFDATVMMIGKVLDPATRRVIVRCTVDNPDEKLKPEMYIHATPLGGERALPHVPNDAIITEGLKSFIFIERSPGVLEKRCVTLDYRGHEESYIATGLNPDERVVISGALLLNAEMAGN